MEKQLASIRSMALKGQRLREGATLVLVGRPNAGKSSLLNRLAGEDRAIVTPIPGTTRDTLREAIQLEGIPLHIIDTAGLRDDATDPVEREGIQRTRAAIAVADVILLMVDDNDVKPDGALIDALPDGIPMIFIHNKIDLSGNAAGRVPSDRGIKVRISLKSGDGIDDLLSVLTHQLGIEPEQEGAFTARRRHLEALEVALSGVLGAQRECQAGSQDLAAEQLRLSQRALSEITGDFSSDDLLGRIFASFCIGK
ncbi:MAG: GTP-binding protein [Gammaproteobacteria bacterium]|nr:GTP-binding protein [Gammaproteobacteria bacterium]NDE55502.1 GTP-binding protein [Gammaproteobacteria bacterium]